MNMVLSIANCFNWSNFIEGIIDSLAIWRKNLRDMCGDFVVTAVIYSNLASADRNFQVIRHGSGMWNFVRGD